MPRQAENLLEIVRRGGIVYTDSRLHAVRCRHCARAFLHDETTGRIFVDAADLRRIVDEEAAPPCPGCNRPDWTLVDVPGEELETFIAGGWGFAFWSPPSSPVRPRSSTRRIAITIAVGTLAVVGIAAVAMNPDPFAAPGHARPQIQVPAGP